MLFISAPNFVIPEELKYTKLSTFDKYVVNSAQNPDIIAEYLHYNKDCSVTATTKTLAIQYGSIEIIESLYKLGYNFDETIINLAIDNGKYDIVNTIFANKKNIDVAELTITKESIDLILYYFPGTSSRTLIFTNIIDRRDVELFKHMLEHHPYFGNPHKWRLLHDIITKELVDFYTEIAKVFDVDVAKLRRIFGEDKMKVFNL